LHGCWLAAATNGSRNFTGEVFVLYLTFNACTFEFQGFPSCLDLFASSVYSHSISLSLRRCIWKMGRGLASYLLWLFARVTERLVRFRFLVRFLRVCGVQVDSVICETVIWAVKLLDQSPHWIPDREDWIL